ncbi:MAG: TonB-dependent receptor [Candidatus Kryptoniota bacterium]
MQIPRTHYVIIFCLCMLSSSLVHSERTTSTSGSKGGVDFRVTVYDAHEKVPIGLARVVLQRGTRVIAEDATNAVGQVWFHGVEPGSYTLTAWFVSYQVFTDSTVVDQDHTTYTVNLQPKEGQLQDIEVVGQRELGVSNIDLGSGNQTFESETYHPPPTAQMTNLIQENLTGAARAPTSEVHIRGSHGEFTYYIDGIPVPLGVFGGLNEVVDPKVIDHATFITGGFPAEYGGQMSAIIDLNNRVPTGTLHLDASTYVGSYLVFNGTKPFSPGVEVASGPSSNTPGDILGGRVGPFRALNSDGEALSISDHFDKLGYYVSASRQETDRRIDTPVPNLFHDHGFDYFLYGKFDYILSDIDYITANLSFGRTSTQVPYDPTVQITSDLQETTNSLQAVSYFRAINSQPDQEENLFIGAYSREGNLIYTSGAIDPPTFQFSGDTTDYNLFENRSFTTLGIRSTFDKRLSQQFMYKVGLNISSTGGAEDFTSRDSLQNPGPSILTDFSGSDFGMFAETEWHPLDWTSFDLGIRYDQHIAPDVPLQHQVSPRIRWNFLIDENSSAYVYFGRLFMPTNIEALRSIAQYTSNSVTATFPERDSYYEAVYTRSFPIDLRLKTAAFFKYASPFTDDAQIGNTAIKTPFNIATVKTTGLELSLSYSDPSTPFSGHVNSSVIHATGSGLLTGGFLPPSSDGSATDLDHDQRLSFVAVINYQPRDWFVNLEATYGSGLSNGHPEDVSNYKTGLFDFNQAAHTTPYWILDCSAGRTFHLAGGSSFEPSIYISNLLDHIHLLKGAYTTGASWEEPRNIVFKIAYHI